MSIYLASVNDRFRRYKKLGESTLDQLSESDIHWQFNDESNSISITVKHIVGNMRSRWTNFLTEDGEKSWRHRDTEFEDPYSTKSQLLENWEMGWACLFNAISPLEDIDLSRKILIRDQQLSVVDAINRQLAHYSYHIGQMVYIARMIKGEDWKSLSIPKGKSVDYNSNVTPKKD